MNKEQQIKCCLSSAIEKFNLKESSSLLCPRKDREGVDEKKGTLGWGAASERAIAHRLAVYLEREFTQELIITEDNTIVVDCEYNRHLQSGKSHEIPPELVDIVKAAKRNPKLITDDLRPYAFTTAPDVADDDSYYVFSIAPDIVVHSRGNDERNLLVVELTKASNTNSKKSEYDKLKLECFTGRNNGYNYLIGACVTVLDDLAPQERKLVISIWFPKSEFGADSCNLNPGSLASISR